MKRSPFDEYVRQLRERDRAMTVTLSPDRSAVRLLRGRLADPINAEVLARDPFDCARRFIRQNRVLLGDIDEGMALANERSLTDRQGMTHVSFVQKHGSALVWGGNASVHYAVDGSVYQLSSTLATAIDVPETPRIDAAHAAEIAKAHAGPGATLFDRIAPSLVVADARTVQQDGKAPRYYLCWSLSILVPPGSDDLGWIYFVDALDGAVLSRDATTRTQTGTGHYSQGAALNSEASGTTFRLRDAATSSAWPVTTKSVVHTYDDAGSINRHLSDYSEDEDDDWDNVGPPRPPARHDDQGPEVDIHRYVGYVLDYYYTTHGHNGWDGAGSDIHAHAHHESLPNNAFWWSFTEQIYFADGNGDSGGVGATRDFVCPLDIVAHEYSHGVKYYFNVLQTYSGETGALDEATSDLFGAFLALARPAEDPWPWHSRQYRLDGTLGRNMIDPARDAAGVVQYDATSEATKRAGCMSGFYPDHYSIRYDPPKPWDDSNDYGGVHFNCPIITHAVYLMINGGTHRLSNVTVTGIGAAPLEQILYRVISIPGYLNNTSDFAAFRLGCINACKDLFTGDLSRLLTLKTGFHAVGVGPDLGIHFIVERSTLGQDEIDARRATGSPVIPRAFRVVVDGFMAAEIGIAGPGGKLEVLSPTAGMTIVCTGNTSDSGGYGADEQRFTFHYDLDFGANDDAFSFAGTTNLLTLNAAIPVLGLDASAQIELIKQPNPFILHGDPPWLSVDLRVFVVNAGKSRFGVDMGNSASDAPGFIQDVMKALNDGNGVAGGESFGNLPDTQEASALHLTPTDSSGYKVFNFALARVRYRGSIGAEAVRVFFRLLSTQSTGTAYDIPSGSTHPMTGSYRFWSDGTFNGTKIPLPGVQGSNYVTIPCFALPRVDTTTTSMTVQEDSRTDSSGNVFGNVQRIAPNSDGSEVDTFFGCWLDTNQPFKPSGDPNKVLPIDVATNVDGPFTAADNPRTIQEAIIRNGHQCLIAEIAFDPVEIPVGVDPSNWDKLAQRNLAWSPIGSARAVTTFQIRATPAATIQSGHKPDELMIDWGDTPTESQATIFLPTVDVADVLAMADRMYTTHQLEPADTHTLQCRTGGITYIPIPPSRQGDHVGLLTVEPPEAVQGGWVFNIVVRQVTNHAGWARPEPSPIVAVRSHASIGGHTLVWRRVCGAFQLAIPVGEKHTLLDEEARMLSVLRWIEQAIPPANRWYAVFSRYVAEMAGRVDGFGGDSDKVAASPTGQWRLAYSRCLLLMAGTVLLIAILLIGSGIQTDGSLLLGGIPVGAVLAGTLYLWWKRCRPGVCKLLGALLAGAGIGTVILALLAVIGLTAPQTVASLVVGAGVTAATAVVSWVKGCFR